MVNPARPPYHIGEQHAAALLPPISATLSELEARLEQYVERLHLSDADRTKVSEARDAVAQAKAKLDQIMKSS